MENEITLFDELHDPGKRIPVVLKILTIILFIGCAFSIIATYFMHSSCEDLDRFINYEYSNTTELQIESKQLWVKMCENLPLLMASSLGSNIICIIGGILIRKLKKTGLYIYLIGNYLPYFLCYDIFDAGYYMKDGITIMITIYSGIVLPFLFMLNRKYLVD